MTSINIESSLEMIKIVANGKQYTLEKNSTLDDFISSLGINAKDPIAIERNGIIEQKSSYDNIILLGDDVLEVITFVGGG